MSCLRGRRPRAPRRRGRPMGAESEPPVDVPTRPGPGPPGPGSEHPPPGPVTEAAGSRSAAVAGNVDRTVIITGNHNVVHQYFVQHYPSLRDYIYDFDAEKKLAERFVGRDELFRRLDDFANSALRLLPGRGRRRPGKDGPGRGGGEAAEGPRLLRQRQPRPDPTRPVPQSPRRHADRPVRPGPRPSAGQGGRGLGIPGQGSRRGRGQGRGSALDRRRRPR